MEKAGLIRSYRDNKDRLQWDLTEEGNPYGVWKDTAKKHGSGAPVRQLLYKKSIVDVLKQKSLFRCTSFHPLSLYRQNLSMEFGNPSSPHHQREHAPAEVFTRVSGVALGFRG